MKGVQIIEEYRNNILFYVLYIDNYIVMKTNRYETVIKELNLVLGQA